MSLKSGRCLSCLLESFRPANSAARSFSSTAKKSLRTRRTARNVKAVDMGLIEAKDADPEAECLVEAKDAHPEAGKLANHLRSYNPLEMKLLKRKYTPDQMKAIRAGEQAISAKDMLEQGRFRSDPLRVEYIDDFATLRPGLDRGAPKAAKAQSRGAAGSGVGAQEAALQVTDQMYLRLSQQTGMDIKTIKSLRTKELVTHRVVNQTRMGKIQSMYFLSIAGNENGMLGIGEGKAAEYEDGSRQAMMNAIRNMKPVPRYEDRTIFGEVEAKVGASIVQLSTRPPGFGNRCQSLIYEIARAAGISDLAARTPRSRNKMNVAKAAFQALTNQRLPEEIARARGRKMVDVRGVYYGGSVH